MKYTFWVLMVFLISACKTYKPEYTFKESRVESIDYSNLQNWAAHYQKEDPSDKTPDKASLPDSLLADVFFIHPTTYTGEKGQDKWNAEISDEKLNNKTDGGSILFQSSAFNFGTRVYAPRYRQAHLQTYFTKDTASAKKALNFAYQDVKNAFEYYLKYLNNGRPVIIAGHSQGTNHAERLLKEYFDGKPLMKHLVVAFLIGMPEDKDKFIQIKPCQNENETGCFVSWRTFKKGYELPDVLTSDNISVTNPLSWKTDEVYMPKTANKGSILKDFNRVYPALVDAQVHKDILWTNKPKFRGSFFLRTKNYHIADINFFYFNIRENVEKRVVSYLLNTSK